MKRLVVHISGHIDLTDEEFIEHYADHIDNAITSKCVFVVGDARGADRIAQEYLKLRRVRDVTVYHMFVAPRLNYGNWPTVGGFTSDATRDEGMTRASDLDLAWVRPGRERSGTAKNIERRKSLTKTNH